MYVIITATLRQPLLADPDTFMHISVGEWILKNGHFPVVDGFSHTAFGQSWRAVDWLGEIALALSYQAAQWRGVTEITTVTFGLISGVLAFYLSSVLRLSVALSLTFIISLLISPHLLARPVIFSYLLLSIWIVLILELEERSWTGSWSYSLIPLMILWANVHASFTFGLVVAYFFFCPAIYKAYVNKDAGKLRHLFILLTGVTIAALITPYGPDSTLRTFRLMRISALSQIVEWSPPNFKQDPVHLVAIIGVFALLAGSGIRLRGPRLLTLLLVTVFALEYKRGLGLFSVVAPLLLARPISAWAPYLSVQDTRPDPVVRFINRRSGTIAVLCAVAVTIAGVLWWEMASPIKPPDKNVPEKAITAARLANVTGNVLNSFRFGGYLIFRGIPPFVDGRIQLYGNQFLRRYFRAMSLRDAEDAARMLKQFDITWALLEPGDPIAFMLETNGWVKLYSDDFAVVFARRGLENTSETPQ
jgi:hypothetical protein